MMSVKEAIILAGGSGTRLQSVVSDVPKPMALIGQTPFLEILIERFHQKGIEHFIISTGYKADIIRSHFANKYTDIKISFSHEKQPLGTGGGIKLAMQKVIGDDVIVMNGDTLFDVDLTTLNRFIPCKYPVIFGRQVDDVSSYGHFVLDGEILTQYKEKEGHGSGLINGGVYLLPKIAFDHFDEGRNFSIEKDYFMTLTNNNPARVILAYDFFIDIGLPETYELAQKILPDHLQ